MTRALRGLVPSGPLARAGVASFVLSAGLVGLNLVIAVVTARALGPEGFGVFASGLAVANVLTIPAVMGIDRVVIRDVARHHDQDMPARARGLLRHTTRLVLAISTVVAIIALVALAARPDLFLDPVAIAVAVGLMPVFALTRMRHASLVGLGRVVAAQLPEALVRPVIYLALITAALLAGADVPAALALAMYLVAAAAAYLCGALVQRRVAATTLPGRDVEAPPPGWWREAVPLTFVSGSGTVIANVPTIAVAAWSGPSDAAFVAIAQRAASLQVLALGAVNAVIGPVVARLAGRGDRASLQRLMTRSARRAFVATLGIVAVMVLFSREMLALFGDAFGGAYPPFLLLSAGQLVNAASGSVGTLLIMSGRSGSAAVGFGLGAGTTVLLSLLLIPPAGAWGAAAATAAGVAAWNVSHVVVARARLGIDPTVFGRVVVSR